jgi:hypothetical protein
MATRSRKPRLTPYQRLLLKVIEEQGGLVLLTRVEGGEFSTAGGYPIRRDSHAALLRAGAIVPQGDSLIAGDTQSWRLA